MTTLSTEARTSQAIKNKTMAANALGHYMDDMNLYVQKKPCMFSQYTYGASYKPHDPVTYATHHNTDTMPHEPLMGPVCDEKWGAAGTTPIPAPSAHGYTTPTLKIRGEFPSVQRKTMGGVIATIGRGASILMSGAGAMIGGMLGGAVAVGKRNTGSKSVTTGSKSVTTGSSGKVVTRERYDNEGAKAKWRKAMTGEDSPTTGKGASGGAQSGEGGKPLRINPFLRRMFRTIGAKPKETPGAVPAPATPGKGAGTWSQSGGCGCGGDMSV